MFDSVDASVAVQNGISDSWSWSPQTAGANSIMNNVLAPVGSWMGGYIDGARNYSESHIGIGGTSLLFGGVEAGTEILALFTGTKSLQAGLKTSISIGGAASRGELGHQTEMHSS